MGWWPQNYQWVVGVVGGMLAFAIAGWALRRLFRGKRDWARPGQDSEVGSQQLDLGEPESGVVTRRRPGAIAAKLPALGLGALAGALVVAGVLYAIALWKGVPIAALPAALVVAVAGSVGALWALVAGLYLAARMAMRRRARRLGVRAGKDVSNYAQSLVLSIDPTEALVHCRAALLSLPQGAELAGDSAPPDEVVGRTGQSARSFGEIVRIGVRQAGVRRAAIEIRSRPVTWQLFDGGINAENVAEIVRFLEARASRIAKREPVADEAPAREDTLLTTTDWLALAYLGVLVGYTGLLILLKELWPEAFAVWAEWSDAVPLDPLRLLGRACTGEAPAVGQSLVPPLNLLIVPTLIAYGAYNTLEFRSKRERMDALNWVLALGSLVFLPLLVLMGCSPDWVEGLSSKYQGLGRFMLEESAGGAVYALLLVIFSNGISFLPASVLARLFRTDSKRQDRGR